MHRGFVTATQLLKPDITFFLGDLFDEGKWASEQDFIGKKIIDYQKSDLGFSSLQMGIEKKSVKYSHKNSSFSVTFELQLSICITRNCEL